MPNPTNCECTDHAVCVPCRRRSFADFEKNYGVAPSSPYGNRIERIRRAQCEAHGVEYDPANYS